jgi:DNA (cytosine-5)-methyltransferase 1
LSLCAGYGGLDLGVDLATGGGARVVCYVEREAYAAAVLAARMEAGDLDPAPVWSDLRTFDGRQWRGAVDLITAGFPCQPFSAAGKRLGLEDERWLWPDIARIVRVVRPRIVFLENVPGLAAAGLGAVLGDLAALGFDAEWSVLRAADVGAPHLRRRLFVLAHAHDERDELGGEAGTGEPAVGGDAIPADAHGCELRPECGRAEPGAGAGEPGDDGATGVVADADINGRQGLAPGRARAGEQFGDDADRRGNPWRGVPRPEPAIRRVDDGPATRVDELRLLGNGVVRYQAAEAWRGLWGEADAMKDLDRELARRLGTWFTPAQVADRLQLPCRTVTDLCKRGDFPGARKFGRTWRIPAESLTDKVESNANLQEGTEQVRGEAVRVDDPGEAESVDRPRVEKGSGSVRGPAPARARRKRPARVPDRATVLRVLSGKVSDVG